MLLSIIICAYNADKYIKRCLDSIYNQDFLDYEIIVINDGSTDKTREIVERYGKEIKLVNKSNTGLADSRNIGLSIAEGEYVWFVDSDDELEIDSFNVISNTIKKSNADILRFNYRRISNNKIVVNPSLPSDIFEKERLNDIRHLMLRNSYDHLFTCWMHIYKRELIKDISFINEKEYAFDDTVFNNIVYNLANKIQIINNILYRYIDNPTSITKKNTSWTKPLLNAYFYLKDKYLEMNIYDEFKDDLIYTFLDSAILGKGEGRGGSLIMEYSSLKDINEAHNYVKELISSGQMQKLINDSIGHKVNGMLMNLYQSIIAKDEKMLFSIMFYLKKNIKEKKIDENSIKLKCKFEYMKMDDNYIAVPIVNQDDNYHSVLTLNEEAYLMMKELESSDNLNIVRNNLYKIFNNDSKEEIDANLNDLIVILKSEQIINNLY